MQTQIADVHRVKPTPVDVDPAFNSLLDAMRARLEELTAEDEPLFRTDARGLFKAYLDGIDESVRQTYNCSCCHRFLANYGGLVTIDANGNTSPALWDEARVPEFFKRSVAQMNDLVAAAKVTGVFLSDGEVVGWQKHNDWDHLYFTAPRQSIQRHPMSTAKQIMAVKRQNRVVLNTSISDFRKQAVEQALKIVRSDVLPGSEKVEGPLVWFNALLASLDEATGRQRHNLLWAAVATAPAGFTNIRSTLAGTLLEDIEAGMSFDRIAKRYQEKVHPLKYQRAQVAPTAGNIEVAEKYIEKLGLKNSLLRRAAKLEDIQEFIWKPKPIAVEAPAETDGVFGHLKPKAKQDVKTVELPAVTMTFSKFLRTVLPAADRLEFYARRLPYPYCTMVTAVDPSAPPLFVWDNEQHRNPVSSYMYHPPAEPQDYGLQAEQYHDVTGITYKAWMWNNGVERITHMEKGVIFLLAGARDLRAKEGTGVGLFPASMRSDLNPIRATIEAYSNSSKLHGVDEGDACGVMMGEAGEYNYRVRVTTGKDTMTYVLDRWE